MPRSSAVRKWIIRKISQMRSGGVIATFFFPAMSNPSEEEEFYSDSDEVPPLMLTAISEDVAPSLPPGLLDSILLCDPEDLTDFLMDVLAVHSAHADILDRILLLLAPAGLGFGQRVEFLRALPLQAHSKCRCDAQWYAKEGIENIAFGCKTCALSSASCVCVACFEAGDHEGHDFYVSRSDYGCCDCGDIFAWKKEGFCKSHSGPKQGDDPSIKLPPAMKAAAHSIVQAVLRATLTWLSDPQNPQTAALIEFLVRLSSVHDGLRRIAGRILLASGFLETLMPKSHTFPATVRQQWAHLIVDLMLDLEFKAEFALLFATQYEQLVLARVGRTTADLGDFTCQMLTRPDVAFRLVSEKGLVGVVLGATVKILQSAQIPFEPALVDTAPAHGSTNALVRIFLEQVLTEDERGVEIVGEEFVQIFNGQNSPPHQENSPPHQHPPSTLLIIDHAHAAIKNLSTVQCSLDLMYLLDHPEVCSHVLQTPGLLAEYWTGFVRVLSMLQFLNPHRRREDTHVEFPDPNWSAALTVQGDLLSSFWLIRNGLRALEGARKAGVLQYMMAELRRELGDWQSQFAACECPSNVFSLHCPLNRVLGLLQLEAGDAEISPSIWVPSFQAFWFHAQVSLDMWKRNGESVLMENQFYRSAFFHHHLASADLTVMRLAVLGGPDEFLNQIFTTLSCQQLPFSEPNINAVLLLLVQLCAQQSELSLDGPTCQRVTALLALQDRSFSQLRDPLLERWTHSLMPAHNAGLEACLDAIAVQTASRYKLGNRQWNSVDLVSPFWSWRDFQAGEERLRENLGSGGLESWFAFHRTVQPAICRADFSERFQSFLSNQKLPAVIFISLFRLLSEPADFRSLKLTIHLILRLCYPVGPAWAAVCSRTTPRAPIPLPDPLTIDSVAFHLNTSSVGCAHPWTVHLGPHSILSLLSDLSAREESAEMKEWLVLAISQISAQCAFTQGERKLVASVLVAKSDRLRAQQLMLERMGRKQAKFLHAKKSVPTASSLTTDCVICLSHDNDDHHRPLAQLGYLSKSALAVFVPRPFLSVTSDFVTFRPEAVGRFITRTCGHSLHADCWRGLDQRAACPYCGRPANFLFDSQSSSVEMLMERLEIGASIYGTPSSLVRLLSENVDQLALSLRKPSGETDLNSLFQTIPLLVELLKGKFANMQLGEVDVIARLTRTKGYFERAVFREIFPGQISVDSVFERMVEDFQNAVGTSLTELAIRPQLFRMHLVIKLFLNPLHELPFEEIVAVEGALSTEDEVGMLIDQMPGWVGKAVSKILQSKETVSSYSLPLLVFEKQTAKFLDAFIKRDSLKFVDSGTLRLVEHLPTIIPALPSIYQKLYTKFLRATCSRCKLPAKAPVICLLCGQVLCCNEAPIHFNTECAKSSFGVFLLLATSIVHIFSGDGVAQWGSLYLDSHGEEDPGLSKPLTLSLERVAVLRAEIRENSWIWRRGAKSLVWRPAG